MTSTIEKRRNLHNRLQEAKRENELLSKEVQALSALANIGAATSMMAHEVNNLLTPIGSYAALALRNTEDQELVRKALKRTHENCKQASEVLAVILATGSGQDVQRSQVALSQLVDDAFKCLCRDFRKDRIIVKVEIPADLTVCGFSVKLQQVLMNLILNARDAMVSCGGTLSIEGQDCVDSVKIRVRDTGCGIKADDLKSIFQPFFTTKTSTAGDGKSCGSGLGLAFCRKVVDEHGGLISVESQPGQGSVFEITLPKSQEGNNRQWPSSTQT